MGHKENFVEKILGQNVAHSEILEECGAKNYFLIAWSQHPDLDRDKRSGDVSHVQL